MKKERLLSLQVLRALACIGIVLAHLGAVSKSFGRSGVIIFFMLSGFVLTYNYYDRDIACSWKENCLFAINKIKKLYLLHLVSFAFMFLITIVQEGFEEIISVKMAIISFLQISLLQSWIPNSMYIYSMNGVAWFLSVMLFLYFCFPLIIRGIHRLKKINTAIICILGCLALQILFNVLAERIFSNEIYGWSTYIWPIYRFGDFFEGCCLGYIFLHQDKKDKLSPVWVSILEVATIILVLFANNNTILLPWITTFLYYICALLAIYLFAVKKGAVTSFLTNNIMIYLGDLSSNIFLIHSVILSYVNVFFYVLGFEIKSWINKIIVLVITFIASILWDKINKLIRIKKTSG